MAFKVAENVQHSTTSHKTPSVVNVPRALPPPASFPPGTSTSLDRGQHRTRHHEANNHKDLSGFMFHHPARGKPSSKRREDYDIGQHPNEVVKHEASRLASSATPTAAVLAVSKILCAISLVFITTTIV